MRRLRVNVRIEGRVVKSFEIPVREPRIEASLRVEGAPEQLPPGVEVPVKIVVRDLGSEPSVVEYLLCPESVEPETCFSVKLQSGGGVSATHTYGVGVHKPVLKFAGRVVASAEFVIREAPLNIMVEPVGELVLDYPEGGVLGFKVFETQSAPFTITAAYADLGGVADVEVEVNKSRGKGYLLSIVVKGFRRPVEEVVLRLKLVIRDALNRVSETVEEFKAVVRASREFIEDLRSRIEALSSEAETLASSGDLVAALIKASEAITVCSSGKPFTNCSSVERLPETLLSNTPIATAYFTISTALESAAEEVKEILAPLASKVEDEFKKSISRVLDALKKFDEDFKTGKYSNALTAAEEAVKLCREMGVIGDLVGRVEECSRAEEALRRIKRLRGFLEKDVVVAIPAKTRLGWFKIGIMARNRLGVELTGVYVDFEPARHYLEFPEEKIVLPPLYPGMEIAREVKVRSLFTGTIVIPYRVCLGDLCVEKRGKIVVGGAAALESVAPLSNIPHDVGVLVGKGVSGLEALGLGPRQAQPLPAEVSIGEYKCTHILGSGGFSVTLLCSRGGVNTVLKIPPEAYWMLLSGGSPDVETLQLRDELLKAFDREARVLRELKHPNIVRLIEYGVSPFPYLAFEYCELGELRRALSAAARLKPKVALEVMIPITAAVATAHAREKPIVHMDIKPENILVTRDYVPKLTDFNIAKIIGTVSRTSAGKGYTQGYAAPEQLGLEGYPPPGTYTDVFALGVVIYELITGIRPYPIETYQNNFRNPLKPKPPSQLNPESPRDLDDILEIALQPNPDDRYRDAAQLLKDLWDVYQQYYYG